MIGQGRSINGRKQITTQRNRHDWLWEKVDIKFSAHDAFLEKP